MANVVIEASSVIYIHGDITAPWDPTVDVVDGCLLALDAGDPIETDWKAASWTPGMTATARLLYGATPGVTGQLAPGSYWLRFRLHDNPEEPVLKSGVVVIT